MFKMQSIVFMAYIIYVNFVVTKFTQTPSKLNATKIESNLTETASNVTESELNYTDTDYPDLFEAYKMRYHRTYPNEIMEQNAFHNYIRNHKEVAKLNGKDKKKYALTGLHDYNLNRYADQDPTELEERFAITMKPYDFADNVNAHEQNYEKSLKQKNIEDLNLYDLDETEDLYEKFKEKYNKKYVHFTAKNIHYYRFYKTLVELNNDKFKGENVTLTPYADIVKDPRAYYFDE